MNNLLLLGGILLIAIIGYRIIKSPLLRLFGAFVLLVLGLGFKDYNKKSPTVGPTMVHSGTSPNSGNDNSSPLTTSSSSSSICTICKNTFSGNGYCEDINAKWMPCEYPHSSLICSEACGRRSSEQFNNASNKIINSQNSSRCTTCGLGHYQNGFCDRCDAASKERVRQSREKLPDCLLCKGTGIEKPMGANSSGESGRICPVCDGTGKQSY